MDKVKMAPVEPSDKGFNDDELANIMNEIESLEKEFLASPVASAPKSEPVVEESPVQEPEAVIEEVAAEPVVAEKEEFDVDAFSDVAVGLSKEEEEPKQIKVETAIFKKTNLQNEIDKELNNVLETLVEAPVDIAVPVGGKVSNVSSFPSSTPSPAPSPSKHFVSEQGPEEKTRMSFHVEGNMSIELSFNIGGNEVAFSVNEADGFVIELGNGAKFTIPVTNDPVRKAS